MKNDIVNRNDIEFLVNKFYDKVKTNISVGYIARLVCPKIQSA